MALNESAIMRVHKDLKKRFTDLHEKTGVPITILSKQVADATIDGKWILEPKIRKVK